jgi:hypothetical protein
MISDTASIHAHRLKVISPRDSRRLILERRQRLPRVKARIPDQYRGLLWAATFQKSRKGHTTSLRVTAEPALRRNEGSEAAGPTSGAGVRPTIGSRHAKQYAVAMLIVLVAAVVLLVLVGVGLRALGTRINGSGPVDPNGSDAARQWADLQERQEGIARLWSGFFR